jgi:molecular chaperone DnaK (HSP70)
MVVNYKNSKIYKLVSLQTDKIYIGSTTQPLYKRFGLHKNAGNKCMSKELIKYDDCKIILIENFECNNKEELCKRERYYIDLYKDIIINKTIPTRTIKEYRQDNKEKINEQTKKYYETNKEKRKEQMKKYREENKEKINEQTKKYIEDNKEKIKEYNKEYKKKYSQDNKEKIKEKLKEYYKNNKETLKEYKKQYYENNKENRKEYQKEYRQILKELSKND